MKLEPDLRVFYTIQPEKQINCIDCAVPAAVTTRHF